MDNSAPLVLRDFQGKIEISPNAWDVRRQALEAAKPIGQVTTPGEQTLAVEALRRLKDIRTGMETTRKSVKAPVLELGRKIDTTAAEFLQDVGKEEDRLKGMVKHYQLKQLELKREEEQRMANDAKHAVELELKVSELRHKAVFEPDPHARAELLRQAAELEIEAVDKKCTAELMVTAVAEKPRGLVVRDRLNFQLWDAILFIQAYPDFFEWHEKDSSGKTVEYLKLKRMAVLDELNREGGGKFHKTRFPEELSQTEDRELVNPPGMRVFRDVQPHVR